MTDKRYGQALSPLPYSDLEQRGHHKKPPTQPFKYVWLKYEFEIILGLLIFMTIKGYYSFWQLNWEVVKENKYVEGLKPGYFGIMRVRS